MSVGVTAESSQSAKSGTKVSEFTSELVVSERSDAAAGVVVLDLAHPDGDDLPAWHPGAHIDLLLDDGLVRQYSLCAGKADMWRIGVLLDPNSRGGSRFVHERLETGSRVRVRGPRNHFPMIDSPGYLFIAGGIGITPMLPMIIAAERAGSDWTLLYLGRSLSTMAFASDLVELHGDRVVIWADDANGTFFDVESALAEPKENTLVYCCGPEPLLAAVERHSAHWPEGSLHIERFAAKPVSEPPEGGIDSFQVECRRSGITVDVSGDTTILDALEEADVPIMSSCLEGVCGTCEAAVLGGVPEHRDSMLSEAERAAGNVILTCVSRSRSERLVLDL